MVGLGTRMMSLLCRCGGGGGEGTDSGWWAWQRRVLERTAGRSEGHQRVESPDPINFPIPDHVMFIQSGFSEGPHVQDVWIQA